jgi:hypothetical protein
MSADQLAYVQGTPLNWADAIHELKPELRAGAYFLTGPCPRCRHAISKSLGPYSGLGFSEGGHETRHVFVRCNCDDEHPGRGSGEHGCGAEGNLEYAQ